MKTYTIHRRLFILSLSVIWLLIPNVGKSQSPYGGTTPLGMAPGAAAGAYPLSGFEDVNLYNGNLNVRLPLLQVGGRGKAQYKMTLRPVQSSWIVQRLETQSFASYEWWSSLLPGYGPGVLQGRRSATPCQLNVSQTDAVTKLTFTASDGTEYELLDQIFQGEPRSGPCTDEFPLTIGANRGRNFSSADGSATFVSDVDLKDWFFPFSANFLPSGFFMLADGTRYRIDEGKVMWMRDANGNQLTFAYAPGQNGGEVLTITDSMNRVVIVEHTIDDVPPYGRCDRIRFKGFDGDERIIRVSYAGMGTALKEGETIKQWFELFPEIWGTTVFGDFHPWVVTKVWLPDDRHYQFLYNSYGEIARIVLPTGGAYEYDYGPGVANAYSNGLVDLGFDGGGTFMRQAIYRRVFERRVYPDGGTGNTFVHRSSYGSGESQCGLPVDTVGITEFKGNGTELGVMIKSSLHMFHGSPCGSIAFGSSEPTMSAKWKDGKEHQTRMLDSDGVTELRRTVRLWQQRPPQAVWEQHPSLPTDFFPENGTRVTETTTTLEINGANLVSKEIFGFDDSVPFNNRNSVKVFDFGAGGPGALLRETRTIYKTDPSYTGTNVHLRNLVTEVSIYGSGPQAKSRTTFEYDNYSMEGPNCAESFHCALQPRSNISGFDSAFNTGYTTRGNVTATTRHILVNGNVTSSISSFSQFDIAGNVVRLIDPRSTLSNIIATTFEFDDRFGGPNNEARANTVPTELTGLSSFAFATKVINALGHTEFKQFDYHLGKPINVEDANGMIAAGYFDDDLDRPTQVRRAIGTADENQTSFAYDDNLRTITTTRDRLINNDNSLVSKTVYDKMGRTIEKQHFEGGSNFILTKMEYDELGRVFKTSNPFRPLQNESVNWTTALFDALGRVKSVTTPDNSVFTTSYAGKTVTTTDQAGRINVQSNDALGRLTNITENPANLNYETIYTYDELDNLRTVTQGSQVRTFGYDSLKRLTSVVQPETGTATTTYTYDNNDNLIQKVDARGITFTYVYDVLNRSTTIDYSNTSINPDITQTYDGAILGKGYPWRSYAGGSESVGTEVEKTVNDEYDILGRLLVKQQFFRANGTWSSQVYETSRTYDLAGNVISQIYPSERTVSYSYDAAGRTNHFSGHLGDGTNRTYAYEVTYASAGQLKQERFGTTTPQVYHKLLYNTRQQLAEIRVSTTGGDDSWNRGKIINGFSLQCSGASCNATDNNGNLRKQQVYIPHNDQESPFTSWYQQYDYDGVNRLERVHEYTGITGEDWQQEYFYDRWGNRRIDTNPAKTFGTGINNRAFDKEDATNRLYAPDDLSLPVAQRQIQYDANGNQTKDAYTGFGAATYDANNRLLSIQNRFGGTSNYTYNADSKRTRRKTGSQELWQIYGIGGELLAEYPANGNKNNPQREYGYRNGKLLITTENGTTGPTGLNATPPSSGSSITLNWASTGAANYRVERKPAGGSFNSIGNTTSTSLIDSGAILGNAYLYRVCSADGAGNCTSGYSNVALGSAITFTSDPTIVSILDDPTGVTVTTVKAAHINELRVAVNAVRDLAGQPLISSPTAASGNQIAVAHVRDLRTKLDEALQALGVQPPAYTDPVLKGFLEDPLNATVIRAAHIRELRQFVRSAMGPGGGGSTFKIFWLVADHLLTARILIDQTGTLANVRRHDYLPFGEELLEGAGVRTSTLGYGDDDGVRQQFTSQERDSETDLDFFGARYYSSLQGRFTGVDPYNIMLEVQTASDTDAEGAKKKLDSYASKPQQWNRYAYGINNPLKYIDPTGEVIWIPGDPETQAQILERIKAMLGDLSKYLKTSTMNTHIGPVMVVSYDRKAVSDRMAAHGGEYGVRMAQILESTRVVEYRIGTAFKDKNGTTYFTSQYGGSATLPAASSPTENTQIWVHPEAPKFAQLGVNTDKRKMSNDGKPLIYTTDIVDAHEFGHAYADIIDNSSDLENSKKRSLEFEKLIRQRKQLPNWRIEH